MTRLNLSKSFFQSLKYISNPQHGLLRRIWYFLSVFGNVQSSIKISSFKATISGLKNAYSYKAAGIFKALACVRAKDVICFRAKDS